MESDGCEARSQKPAATKKDSLIAAETQTDYTNLHSESICCLSNIPYADMTNSPPPLPPSIRRTKEFVNAENLMESHQNENHAELNQLSARNLQLAVDTSIGGTDNGDVQCKRNDNVHGGEKL